MINKKDLCLVLCYAEWCGHCEHFITPLKKDELSWSQVKEQIGIPCTQFEEQVLKGNSLSEKGKAIDNSIVKLESDPNSNLFDFNELLQNANGWPTILMCNKGDGGKYTVLQKYNGSRAAITNFKDFAKKCLNDKGENKEVKKEEKKEDKKDIERDELRGGIRTDYQKKYKKYKAMYAKLVIDYNKLKTKLKKN